MADYWTTDYWNALDAKEKFGPGVDVVGSSTHPAKDQLQELKGKIFAGLSHVELGFFGRDKGNRAQAGTPESYGKDERQAMRELATINEVSLSTHASANVIGFAGLKEGGFKEEAREAALNEVKKAVEFAADTAQGGPVVIHTDEYPRPIYEAEDKFKAFEDEEKKRIHYLVDSHTGKIIQPIEQNEVIYKPIPETRYNPQTRKQEIVYQEEIDGTTKKDALGNPIPIYKLDERGDIQVIGETFSEFKENFVKSPEFQKEFGQKVSQMNPDAVRAFVERESAKEFFRKQKYGDVEHAIGQASEYELRYKIFLKERNALINAYKIYEQTPEKDRWKIREKIDIPAHVDAEEFLKERIKNKDKEIKYAQEIAISSRKQAEGVKQIMERVESIHDYGTKQSANTVARAAIYAFEKEKAQGLKKPLYISPESWLPEQYGGHPRELKEIVLKSRNEMQKMLQEPRFNYSESQARKISEDHIKATFDTGHAYTWKKYFKSQPGETLEQTDKRFNKWLIDEAKKLQKEGILGHVHLADNFGYADEHLSPGEGSVPIKEFVKEIQKAGFKGKMIVEAGGQPEGQAWRATTSAWKTLNSPIYRVDSQQQSWGDVESSYFGRTGSSSYIVGDIAPSKDWAFWTETPIE